MCIFNTQGQHDSLYRAKETIESHLMKKEEEKDMKNYIPVSVSEDDNNNNDDEIISMNSESSNSSSANNPSSVRRVVKATVLFAAITLACLVLLSSLSLRSFSFLPLIPLSSTRSFDSDQVMIV